MDRKFVSYTVSNVVALKERLLCWAAAFPVCCALDNFGYKSVHHSYDLLIGAGVAKFVQADADNLESLSDFDSETEDWIFGHLTYDSMGRQEKRNHGDEFPAIYFYIPLIVIQWQNDRLTIGSINTHPNAIYASILSTRFRMPATYKANFLARTDKQHFITTIQKLQQHIQRGDCYEINYCQEFYAESIAADPIDLYRQLTSFSPTPFACFYRNFNQFALCASPERYLKRTGNKLISQPIKGTAARSPDLFTDALNRQALERSEKDRRENIIVVDLVRNDLSRVCKPGSVMVEELCAIYDFPSVYQMISTISGELEAAQNLADILQATFPMGSMTGAPKNKVMELIEKYEPVNRGLYSGTIGYIDPDKNFDFNVVIRTLFYNQRSGYLNYFAGAGITAMSDPQQEYDECLLKASALNTLFGTFK